MPHRASCSIFKTIPTFSFWHTSQRSKTIPHFPQTTGDDTLDPKYAHHQNPALEYKSPTTANSKINSAGFARLYALRTVRFPTTSNNSTIPTPTLTRIAAPQPDPSWRLLPPSRWWWLGWHWWGPWSYTRLKRSPVPQEDPANGSTGTMSFRGFWSSTQSWYSWFMAAFMSYSPGLPSPPPSPSPATPPNSLFSRSCEALHGYWVRVAHRVMGMLAAFSSCFLPLYPPRRLPAPKRLVADRWPRQAWITMAWWNRRMIW